MITVYAGPMFSGKSAKMFDVRGGIYYQKFVMVFKAKTDTRTVGKIWTRSNPDNPIEAIEISDLKEIESYLKLDTRIVFIDEAMLIQGNPRVLIDLSINLDLDIYVAGLDLTSEQQPFGIMPGLLAVADKVVKSTAECSSCGREATFSYYMLGEKGEVVIGDSEYTALCGKCLVKAYDGREGFQEHLGISRTLHKRNKE